MIYSEHLITNFFISKPQQTDPEITSPQTSQVHTKEKEQENYLQGQKTQTARLLKYNQKKCDRGNTVYKMITNKIRPSTAVSTQLRSQKSSVHKTDHKANFLLTFERFLKEYVKQDKNNASEQLRLRKRSIKKKKMVTTACTKSLMTYTSSDQSDFDDFIQDIDMVQRIQQKKKKLNYHQRIKENITNKIDNIVNSDQINKLSKIQTLDKRQNLNVGKVLWLKNRSKKAESKMRVIRTGLPIRLTQMDPKIKNTNFSMKQIQKARKDLLFQKTMAKNCQIILSEIDNYKKQGGSNDEMNLQLKKRNSDFNYLKSTKSKQLKNRVSYQSKRQSSDNLQQLKWTEKCMSIEWRCDRSSNKYKKLKKGLKIFEGYCDKMNKKLIRNGELFNDLIESQNGDEFQY